METALGGGENESPPKDMPQPAQRLAQRPSQVPDDPYL
jgi:hypothetical protein